MSCNIVRLCGITSRFQLLSPSTRQVTHALLTRPPLSHKELQTEVIRSKCFVRLACVKHAASVHPEPGSNSHKKFLSFQNPLAEYPFPFHLTVSGSHLLSRCIFRCCSLNYSLWIFQGYFTVQLSRFFIVSLRHNSFSITSYFLSVNNFSQKK